MTAAYPLESVRSDFPMLARSVHGKPLAYLDNAATTLKPAPVIEAMCTYCSLSTANIHRGAYFLSEQATLDYEHARETVRGFINARSAREIIFTRGTTESINLVAYSYGRRHLKAGDEIVLTGLEHHANIVPWQVLREETGCVLRVAPLLDDGSVDLPAFERLLGARTRLVAVAHVSNTLGTVLPVPRLIAAAHAYGARVLVDAAQSIACRTVDVSEWDCDFLAFSGHKVFGPTGIGVLYGREELLDGMPPFLTGGGMILSVSFDRTVYGSLPQKFEAGTPPIAEAIGLGRALDYVRDLGIDRIAAHEDGLYDHACNVLADVPGLRIIGTAPGKASILQFTLGSIHPHDVGSLLDGEGIAVRTGHHCAQPVMQRFGVPATVRASFSLYNTPAEADRLAQGLRKVLEIMT